MLPLPPFLQSVLASDVASSIADPDEITPVPGPAGTILLSGRRGINIAGLICLVDLMRLTLI